MIITSIEGVRDPFILVESGVYYLYGTGIKTENDWENTEWVCYVNRGGKLDGNWEKTKHRIYEIPRFAKKEFWAPEVHPYKGAYYMFSTYYSSATKHRGCAVLKASSPTGPFSEISNGHITPKDWNAIDATLYVDREGQPWIIFVNEWVCTDDNIGRMAAAKLSDDLTQMISTPVELFRADAPVWTDRQVTDGCFMYTTKENQLLMLWSNFDRDGYTVAVAHSQNGKIDGKWEHEPAPIYKKGSGNLYDGGHGMIFTALDGQKYLSIHSPNLPCGRERVVFIPICEKNGTLVCEA